MRVRVTHCALCRTDAKMWQQGHRDLVLPRVLGHEICGFREETGERFAVWPGKSCGNCPQCRHGAENLCPHIRIVGFHCDGGLAEAVRVSRSSLIPIADNISGELACLAEPLACSLNALEQAQLCAGEKVLIYGGGPVGLMMALVVQSMGAEPLIVENNPLRIQQTETFRMRLGLNAVPQYGGLSSDLVVNACSSLDAFRQGLWQLRSGGRFCLFSGFPDEAEASASLLNEVHYRQLKVVGAYGCTRRQMRPLPGYHTRLTVKLWRSSSKSASRSKRCRPPCRDSPRTEPESRCGFLDVPVHPFMRNTHWRRIVRLLRQPRNAANKYAVGMFQCVRQARRTATGNNKRGRHSRFQAPQFIFQV